MRARHVFAGAVAIIVVGVAAAAGFAWRGAIDPVDRPTRNVDPALVKRGADLAAIGNCNVCHTAPGGKVFAGGLALPSPFGTIYSTNITPDPQTGIGRWPEAAFQRAMREGVSRDGHRLYPAFPYDHYTLVSDEDNRALYAYLLSREPVQAQAPKSELRFPYNIRPLLAGWNALFLRKGPYQADSSKSAEWNRGAYLVEGLGHCGGCHTPRNRFGAEDRDKRYDGGEAEGWTAYAINGASPAPVPWDAEALYAYLRQGWHPHHGVARGPMAPVVQNLSSVPESDVRAIATYVASLMGTPSPERRQRGEALLARLSQQGGTETASNTPARGSAADTLAPSNTPADAKSGEAIYASACGTCHGSGRPAPYGGLDLTLSSAINGPNPHNLVNVVLTGLPATEGEPSPIMPGFANVMSDAQLSALVGYLRSRFSDKPAWTSVRDDIRQARDGERAVSVRPTPSSQSAPADATQREKAW